MRRRKRGRKQETRSVRKASSPTPDEWRHLYEAAIAFKKAAPWEWMAEDQLFGVQNPESEEVGYVSVMGMAGEHFALAIYRGSEGLEGFWQLHSGEVDPTFLLEVPQLQASWENRSQLHKEDLEVIKALGLKFRGRHAWPMFRNYTPGFFPWFVTAEEARFLTLALEQGLDVALRVREDPALLGSVYEGTYLIRTPAKQADSLVWRDEWQTVPPAKPHLLPPSALTASDLTSLRRLPHRAMTLEVDLFLMPTPIQEGKDARPYFPYNLMIVEAQSGMILGADLLAPQPTLDAVWSEAPMAFAKALQRLKSLPVEVTVRQERVYHLLEPVTTELGIRLTQRPWLPALDQAKAAFEQWQM